MSAVAWASAAGAASLLYWGPALSASHPRLRAPLGIRDRVTDIGAVGLTFDDGPHPQGTPAALEVLRDTGAHATFFLVGEQVERRPALAAEIVAAGHDVALHCHRHRNLLRLTPREVRDDLDRACALIAEGAGRAPRLYRPPYGVITAAALVLARRRGWEPMLWTRWARDWEEQATAESIAAKVSDDVRAGDVLLLHDADYYSASGSWRRTVAALPRVLERVAAEGLRTAAV